MRPKLKVSHLISLQDARSSAAVGFDLISFNLARGHKRKLSVSMVWNLVQWLSGPEIVIEMNLASLPELEEAQKQFRADRITLPAAEWSHTMLGQLPPTILHVDDQTDPEQLSNLLSQAPSLRLELSLCELDDVLRFQSVLDRSLVHFPSLNMARSYVSSDFPMAWGISLGLEAEEEPGVLDYEQIDYFIEDIEARFEED